MQLAYRPSKEASRWMEQYRTLWDQSFDRARSAFDANESREEMT
jgi:hypothetical protein